MPQQTDPLAFIDEIRVAEFWRKQLGEAVYSQRDPDDLYRWYKAMDLRGPDEIRAYVEERMGRFPSGAVTGIVSSAPHPTREIIDVWLATHDKVRTAPYWISALALVLACLVMMPNLNGCQSLKSPIAPVNWMPQAAMLTPGQLNGAPQATSTLPSLIQPVGIAARPATTIAQQHGMPNQRGQQGGGSSGGASFTQQGSVSSAGFSSSSGAGSAQPIVATPNAGSNYQSAPQGAQGRSSSSGSSVLNSSQN